MTDPVASLRCPYCHQLSLTAYRDESGNLWAQDNQGTHHSIGNREQWGRSASCTWHWRCIRCQLGFRYYFEDDDFRCEIRKDYPFDPHTVGRVAQHYETTIRHQVQNGQTVVVAQTMSDTDIFFKVPHQSGCSICWRYTNGDISEEGYAVNIVSACRVCDKRRRHMLG
jgi:hypothetical protein